MTIIKHLSKRGNLLPHAEALTQNILGMIIAFAILHLWGMSMSESVALQCVFFITSYIRSYLVRKVLKRFEIKQLKLNIRNK